MEENKLFNKVEQLKKDDEDFATLLTQIEVKIKAFQDMINGRRGFKPSSSIPKLNISVDAVKLTNEEFEYLIEFLNKKYINKVAGDYFCIKKKFFSNKYKIYTKKRAFEDFTDYMD